MKDITIFWFRRDLRLVDNSALYYALKNNEKVLPIFIFDETILIHLEDKKDKRVAFIHAATQQLKTNLEKLGSSLLIFKGNPLFIFEQLIVNYSIKNVYTNHDYEPLARRRDAKISTLLASYDILFCSYKDQVIFEKNEITKDDGKPYTVFTPYSKKWKNKLTHFYTKSYPTEIYYKNLSSVKPFDFPTIESIGFEKLEYSFIKPILNEEIVLNYTQNRDFPALSGTSKLSVHLRFGTISIRQLTQKALELNETWLNELIWRDFYMMILYHFPHVSIRAFKPKYDAIIWRNNQVEFKAWCDGQTGYPLVDAGMRELNATGFMHNRVRMVVASFLVKHLLIDWRWGEAYFAQKLLDFDLAANNGGWQWTAGCGCDSAPYFRVFNPYAQTIKFDKNLEYIKKWVPEFKTQNYPQPIVDHSFARERVLGVYKTALELEQK